MRAVLIQAMVAICVMAFGLLAYDHFIRLPRTPHLAVVDVAALYAAAERRATHAVAQPLGNEEQALAATAAAAKTAADFGPALQTVLKQLSSDCRCTLVAMAAVFGSDSTVPDYTAEAARRLGMEASR